MNNFIVPFILCNSAYALPIKPTSSVTTGFSYTAPSVWQVLSREIYLGITSPSPIFLMKNYHGSEASSIYSKLHPWIVARKNVTLWFPCGEPFPLPSPFPHLLFEAQYVFRCMKNLRNFSKYCLQAKCQCSSRSAHCFYQYGYKIQVSAHLSLFLSADLCF